MKIIEKIDKLFFSRILLIENIYNVGGEVVREQEIQNNTIHKLPDFWYLIEQLPYEMLV